MLLMHLGFNNILKLKKAIKNEVGNMVKKKKKTEKHIKKFKICK